MYTGTFELLLKRNPAIIA